jgi:hypothetical protein
LFVVSKRTKRKNRTKFFALKAFRAIPHAFYLEKTRRCQANTAVSRAGADGWTGKLPMPSKESVIAHSILGQVTLNRVTAFFV